jgi:hypothetical protein
MSMSEHYRILRRFAVTSCASVCVCVFCYRTMAAIHDGWIDGSVDK